MKAYAKLNLLLHVINKREDGYHNLQMVNCKIDLYDNIYIKRNSLNVDTINAKNIDNYICDDNNLILKVVKQFKIRYNIKVCYDILIEKNIPFGSGLGGVSMDVGEVLKFIIKDNNIKISKAELIEFTKPFGADIPYSFIDTPAIIEGIGDIITEIKLKEKQMILVIPDINISTPIIFQHNKTFSSLLTHDDLLIEIESGKRRNDLTISSRKVYKGLDDLIIELEKYGNVVMSGSGCSLTVEPLDNIDVVLNELKTKYNKFNIIKIITKEG